MVKIFICIFIASIFSACGDGQKKSNHSTQEQAPTIDKDQLRQLKFHPSQALTDDKGQPSQGKSPQEQGFVLSKEDMKELKSLPEGKKLMELSKDEKAIAMRLMRKVLDALASDVAIYATCAVHKRVWEVMGVPYGETDMKKCLSDERETLDEAKNSVQEDAGFETGFSEQVPLVFIRDTLIRNALLELWANDKGKTNEEMDKLQQGLKEKLRIDLGNLGFTITDEDLKFPDLS